MRRKERKRKSRRKRKSIKKRVRKVRRRKTKGLVVGDTEDITDRKPDAQPVTREAYDGHQDAWIAGTAQRTSTGDEISTVQPGLPVTALGFTQLTGCDSAHACAVYYRPVIDGPSEESLRDELG